MIDAFIAVLRRCVLVIRAVMHLYVYCSFLTVNLLQCYDALLCILSIARIYVCFVYVHYSHIQLVSSLFYSFFVFRSLIL